MWSRSESKVFFKHFFYATFDTISCYRTLRRILSRFIYFSIYDKIGGLTKKRSAQRCSVDIINHANQTKTLKSAKRSLVHTETTFVRSQMFLKT